MSFTPYDESAASTEDRVAWALCQIIDDDAPLHWTRYRFAAECIARNERLMADLRELGELVPVQLPSLWLVMKEHAWEHEGSDRPTLAYLLPAEFPEGFASFEEARDFIHRGPSLPIGWVAKEFKLPVKERDR